MKIKNGFLVKKNGEQTVVVAAGEENRDSEGIISLNDTGIFLWDKLRSETTEKALTCAMLLEYDIDEATAAADVSDFIRILREAELLS